jgi:hypothetical protein
VELLFWAWAAVAGGAFLWTAPWMLKNFWNNEIELFGFVAWPIVCALVPFLIVLGFLVIGWEKMLGREIIH